MFGTTRPPAFTAGAGQLRASQHWPAPPCSCPPLRSASVRPPVRFRSATALAFSLQSRRHATPRRTSRVARLVSSAPSSPRHFVQSSSLPSTTRRHAAVPSQNWRRLSARIPCVPKATCGASQQRKGNKSCNFKACVVGPRAAVYQIGARWKCVQEDGLSPCYRATSVSQTRPAASSRSTIW